MGKQAEELRDIIAYTVFPAYSDTLGTWEKCHCNQIVTVTRGRLVTNQSFGKYQKCHCKRGVTVNSVTVSGEICIYQNSLSHLDYQRRRFGAPFSDISRGVCRRGPSRRSIRVRRPDLSGLGEAPALARRWNSRWKSLLGIKMDSDLGVFFGPVQDLEKVRFPSCANLLFKITQPFK